MRIALACLLAAFVFASWAQADTAALAPAEEARYQNLISQLRCLVCQNQSIAESNAPLAEDLRMQVHSLMREGRSDEEILHYLTTRYGDFVLYRPPVKRKTWLLWGGPFVILGLALIVAYGVLRSGRKGTAPAPPDAKALRRILEEREP